MQSTTGLLGNVADLNNSAAAELLQTTLNGRPSVPGDEARHLLIQGLQELKAIIESDDDHHIVDPSSLRSFSVRLLNPDPSVSEPTTDGGAQEIFNGAFVFDTVEGDISQCSNVAAVILYNLGLVNHRKGLKSGMSAHVKAALQFYERSHALLHQQQAEQGTHHSETFHYSINILVAALLVNIAHACNYFYETKKAAIVFRELARHMEDILDIEDVPLGAVTYFKVTLVYNLQLRRDAASPAA